jgi:hypothetical protein
LPIIFKSILNYDVKWYCDEILIENNEKYLIINDSSSTMLQINSVDVKDQKQYVLVIKNPKETIVNKTFLEVEGIILFSMEIILNIFYLLIILKL